MLLTRNNIELKNIMEKIVNITNKHELLDIYIKNNDIIYGKTEQGTDAWLAKRKKTIGGSEFSFIVGTDISKKHTTDGLIEFVKSKIYSNRIEAMPLFWGNLFEDVICRYMEKRYQTDIKIPGSLKGIYKTSYSPDGLAVINNDLLLTDPLYNGSSSFSYDKNKSLDKNESIVLFEFKCPYSRNVDNKIPNYYLPQILSGLDNIYITNAVIFAEAIFRICDKMSIDIPFKYNKCLYRDGIDKFKPDSKPVCKGVIGVYMKNKISDIIYTSDDPLDNIETEQEYDNNVEQFKKLFNYSDEIIKNTENLSTNHNNISSIHYDGNKIIDFGEDGNIFKLYKYDKYCRQTKTNKITFNYYDNYVESMQDIDCAIDNMSSNCNDKIFIGFLSWKLYKVNIFQIWKDKLTNGYIESYKDRIQPVMNIIDGIYQNKLFGINEFTDYVTNNIPDFIL